MANRAVKTEHSGAKHGEGAYYGRKHEAKRESNKARRREPVTYDPGDMPDDDPWLELGSDFGAGNEQREEP